MSRTIKIGERLVGDGQPCYVVAELSGNHNHDPETALAIIRAAKEAGADAIKLQTYTASSLTIRCDNDYFRIKGTLWNERTLFELYEEASTPWEWHPVLFETARELGLDIFSTPFDAHAVEFLERFEPPAYKIASFELVDLELIESVARTGKPLILSTGMAEREEIDRAVAAARGAGATEIVLLRCNSAYPASPREMDLRTIEDLRDHFDVPIGLSDHTLTNDVAIAAVALGACMVEKHVTLSRSLPGPDSAFSLEPEELAGLVRSIRTVESAMGSIRYGVSPSEEASRVFRRSLFVVEDVAAGEKLTRDNIRSIRPGYGLSPHHLPEVLGRRAARDLPRGTPLSWDVLT